MFPEHKEPCFCHAQYLNSRTQLGLFVQIPNKPCDESSLRSLIRRECKSFWNMMIRSLISLQMRNVRQKCHKLPQKRLMEGQALRQMHVSIILHVLMFGHTYRQNSRLAKAVAKSLKNPVYLHYFSADRM